MKSKLYWNIYWHNKANIRENILFQSQENWDKRRENILFQLQENWDKRRENILFQSRENWNKRRENILSNAKIGIILYKYICPEFCRIFQDFINKYLMKLKLYWNIYWHNKANIMGNIFFQSQENWNKRRENILSNHKKIGIK
jgi:hypothetical protein